MRLYVFFILLVKTFAIKREDIKQLSQKLFENYKYVSKVSNELSKIKNRYVVKF